MTEIEWLRLSQPKRMIDHIQRAASVRKEYLFGCATCRRVWDYLNDSSRQAIEILERFADSSASKKELKEAEIKAESACIAGESIVARAARAVYAATGIGNDGMHPTNHQLMVSGKLKDRKEQASILNDIFGNPFRPVTLDPRWLSSTVLDLANTIYDERAFERLPILADALMDAGCDSEEIIEHCRGPGPHVRGCWVVDLLTVRE